MRAEAAKRLLEAEGEHSMMPTTEIGLISDSIATTPSKLISTPNRKARERSE